MFVDQSGDTDYQPADFVDVLEELVVVAAAAAVAAEVHSVVL